MRYKLRILRLVKQTDDYGAESTTWEETRTVWAERAALSGSMSVEVGERFPDYQARFNIRDVHEVEENWRVEQLGGHLYTVTNIEPNRARGMLTLCCERVNE